MPSRPGRLAGLEGFPGLFARKVENLRALGRAAADGRLDGAGSGSCLANRPWTS